jgi:(1->4)-alpha-D-glucan 1-alpha-D-glucosylmutase
MQRMDEGLPKLWTIHRALTLRHQCSEAFGSDGDYTPLTVEGAQAGNYIAFQRGANVIAIAPRFANIGADAAITLPPGVWCNVLTNQTHQGGAQYLADLLPIFPIALLTREN